MTAGRQRLGRHAEDLVAERLAREGWRIVARNARLPQVRGELDLVAFDGAALVFVEVKALREGNLAGPELPALAVGPRKRAKLRSLAAAWLREHGGGRAGDLRFDVVGLRLDAAGRVSAWEHLRGAF